MLIQILSDLKLNIGPATYASLFQAALGLIASRLKVFNIDKATYRKGITEITEKAIEEMSVLLTSILERKVETDIPIRGEPPTHEDIIAKFNKLIFVKCKTFVELERDFFIFKFLNKCLFFNALTGIVFFVIVTFWPVDVDVFFLAIMAFILIEVICITLMFFKVEKLDRFN